MRYIDSQKNIMNEILHQDIHMSRSFGNTLRGYPCKHCVLNAEMKFQNSDHFQAKLMISFEGKLQTENVCGCSTPNLLLGPTALFH